MVPHGDDLRQFWRSFQSGVEVAVAESGADELLGVREGFRRFFHDAIDRPVPVVVVPQDLSPLASAGGLAPDDASAVRQARRGVALLQERVGAQYQFFVANSAGIQTLEIDSEPRHFIRVWTVVRGPMGEAWAGSGSLQTPADLWLEPAGNLAEPQVAGKRRRGGLLRDLTSGLETRRSAVALATTLALSSLLRGFLEVRPTRAR
jgi:hypothetical protein